MERRDQLKDARRIVVKLGTNVITHAGAAAQDGIALGRLNMLIEAVAREQRAGRQMLMVSSGAVGMGQRALGHRERPRSLGLRQACAAVGQGQLIALYSQAFGLLGVQVAQVLLTQADLADRDRLLCLRTTLTRLIELGVVPVLNENDSVSVRELIEHRGQEDAVGFGDNDELSARVALAVDADLLVLLTDVDGCYTADPRDEPTAMRFARLERIEDALVARAAGSTSAGGTGGMASKLAAARAAAEGGTAVLITSGHNPKALQQALAGEDVGTFIPAPSSPGRRRRAHRRAIAVAASSAGALVINEGALQALVQRKASLLPVGVIDVIGEFSPGDVVELRDASGRAHGRGLVNYAAAACRALKGRKSGEIAEVLGWQGYDTLISRENLVLSSV